MAIRVQKLDTPDIPSILLLGGTGVGKTYMAATITKYLPTLFINVEKRKQTLLKFADTLKSVVIDNIADINELIALGKLKEKEAVVIDSISALQDNEKLYLIKKNNKAVANQYIYNLVDTAIKGLMRDLQSQGKIVICTSMIKKVTIEDNVYYLPNLFGNFGDSIGQYFNIIGHIGHNRIINFVSDGNNTAKVEFAGFPEKLENPDMMDILKLTKGGVT